MGWHEYYERKAALDTVVADGLTVPAGFDGEDEVLLALHHRWSMRLAGRVDLAVHDIERDPDIDPVDAVGAAWRATAESEPDLRRLLDEHAEHPALRAVTLAEQAMLARAAGLTEQADGAAEQAAVGAAFLALVRSRPGRAERRNPVERLLRRLVPSA
ncbi:hypothetical protein [Actinophytocola gossypii]|uniref:Uncharacterized protein n=1 Tax=Actinophytocola gossypii TaxID=2812003 RepID=A0ABT2J8E8_9PSEU|nr:hypothetical protein [Actinophytocola gossypii]MCT2584135.1 hypothetical protein [Actinophytocola gossypii]